MEGHGWPLSCIGRLLHANMTPCRVPLSTLQGTEPPEKSKVAVVIFGKLQVALIRIIDIANCYIVICQRETDVDKLNTEEAE